MYKKTFFKSSIVFYTLALFLSTSSLSAADVLHGDPGNRETFGAEELVRGERLFYGLIYQEGKSVNCASCHNTRFSDSLNWNPDAYEISQKYSGLTAEELKAVLLRPRGQKLAEVHKGFDLSEEDIVLIKAYMDIIAHEGLVQPKPVINKLLLFIFAGIILLISLADLVVIKKIRPRWILLILILGPGFYITSVLAREAIAIGRSKDYSPDQPIKFSHAVHAGQNQTNCLYCHPSAEYSKSAGIPSANVCMNCHLIVRNGTHSGSWEINKLIAAYENKEAIEWVRVYNNPDHVFFSHAQHVSVGGLECQECHGEVEKMDRIIQVSDLSMGWCINCHRENEVDFHSNAFYRNYEGLRKKAEEGELNKVTVEKIGGTECMKCHY